jgi:hypothetical protein
MSKFFFFRKVSSFVGYTLNGIIIPSLLVFKPSKLLNLLEKGLSYLRVFLSIQAEPDYPVSETGLSNFHILTPLNRTYPFTTSLTSHSYSLKSNREGGPRTSFGDFLTPPCDS